MQKSEPRNKNQKPENVGAKINFEIVVYGNHFCLIYLNIILKKNFRQWDG